jgi:PAS domain S-box-containing protein
MLNTAPRAVRYGSAVAAVGLALVLKLLLDPLIQQDSPFLLFFSAVMVAALVGGLGPGLVATALAAVVSNFFFLEPYYSLRIGDFGQALRVIIFVFEGVLVTALVTAMHAARRRAETSARLAQEDRDSLERSEERFRLLVEGAKDYAILMLDTDGRVESWNDGARRILGYSEDEILGRPFSTFFPEEDRQAGAPERELGRAVAEGVISDESWAVRKDGTRFWANGSTSAVRDADGELVGLVRVFRDRTEARRAEEERRLRDRAIDSSANGIVITDPNLPDHPIVYANPAFLRMTGYAEEEVLGRNCRFLQGDDRGQEAIGELRAAIRAGRTAEVVLRNYRKDGTLFWNDLTVSPVFDDEGNVIRFVGIQDDITQQKLAEDALRVQAEASEVLAMPLDYEERLASLARLAVPRIADWCAIDVVGEDGSVRRLAVEHQDPGKMALAFEIERRYPPDPDAPRGVPNVLKTGEAEMMHEIPDELLRQSIQDPEQLAMFQELGLRSYMIVPMIARGRTLGAITLVSAESGRRYGPEDLERAETLVRRAAMAVDNARLYEEAQREISERERAEASLIESDDRLRLATEATGLGTFDFKPQTGELVWDARCKEIFGLPPDADVDFELFLARIHPDDRAPTDEAVNRALDPAGDGEFEIEYRVVGDGAQRWVDARGRAFFEDGAPVRFIGTVLDVTEEKQAEEALKRSEERYRAVIEQSTEGIFLIDTGTRRLLETNPAFQRMFGYAAEELRGMELYDLIAHSRDDIDANIGRTLEVGRRLIGERTYRRKDGTTLEVEVGVSTISYNSHHAICAVVRDVTARKRAEEALKRSEERFRSLVRYASDIIVVLDAGGEILYESPAIERVLGFTPEERMGTNAFDYLHPEDRGPVGERFARLATEPGGRISAEYRARDKDGDWHFFEAIGANLLEDPVIRGIVVNSRDVTERKRTEQALSEIRESERGRIARELHDGVLQDLSYTAQAMEVTRVKYGGTGVEDELEEGAEAIRRAARDLREAIYDLRAYRHGTQDAKQLFESMLELTRRRMPNVEIESDLDEGLVALLSARGSVELLRIVQEAFTNVRRHSGAHSARLALSSSDGKVLVEVTDDGRGFDPDLLPPGVGTVGMRERALGLGGTLTVESQPGAGTTVRFEVPLENVRRQ